MFYTFSTSNGINPRTYWLIFMRQKYYWSTNKLKTNHKCEQKSPISTKPPTWTSLKELLLKCAHQDHQSMVVPAYRDKSDIPQDGKSSDTSCECWSWRFMRAKLCTLTGRLTVTLLEIFLLIKNHEKLLLVKKTFHLMAWYRFAITTFKQSVNLPLADRRVWGLQTPAEGMSTSRVEVWGFGKEWLAGVDMKSGGIVLLRWHFNFVDHINFLVNGKEIMKLQIKMKATKTNIYSIKFIVNSDTLWTTWVNVQCILVLED